jgi:hypothetical protein
LRHRDFTISTTLLCYFGRTALPKRNTREGVNHFGASLAQSPSAVVDTWKVLSVTTTDDTGVVQNPFGENPLGFITYTADGRMSVIINASDRKPLSGDDRAAAPVAERAEAFATMVAYAGRYTFTGDKVVHHVEASAVPNDVGTDLVRSAELDGDRLTLRTPMQSDGEQVVVEVVWQRLPKSD